MKKTYEAKYPIIFVTGIGQTWTSLKYGGKERWNLFPTSFPTMFDKAQAGDFLNAAAVALRAGFSAFSGKDIQKREKLDRLFKQIFKYSIADANGNLPDKADIRIYGARSFDVLKKVDFQTGLCNETTKDSLYARMIRDIPCSELEETYGAENMYCFNYSSFSNLYTDADNLHKMIKGVIEDQKNKTGADKVILVPMSMGATVVNAYIDKYYGENGAVDGDYVEKIVSIVGAWNGSDALADMLSMNVPADFKERVCKLVGEKGAKVIAHMSDKAFLSAAELILSSLVETVLLNTSSFTALIPKERYELLRKKLFSPAALERKPSLLTVRAEADRYNAAQFNLKNKLSLLAKSGKGIYFISGYGLEFGGRSRDFAFLSLFESADKTNSDGVIQISSTAPGTSFVLPGEKFASAGEYVSPDGSVNAGTAVFPETSWYFEGQEHELGMNNTALNLAGDIALGRVENIHNDLYPQFNKRRSVAGMRELLAKAEKLIADGTLPENRALSLGAAAEQVKIMMSKTINDPENDEAVMNAFRTEMKMILA